MERDKDTYAASANESGQRGASGCNADEADIIELGNTVVVNESCGV